MVSLRESAASALRRFPVSDVVPRIFAALEDHADPAPAVAALALVTRENLGDDLDAWRTWWDRRRNNAE